MISLEFPPREAKRTVRFAGLRLKGRFAALIASEKVVNFAETCVRGRPGSASRLSRDINKQIIDFVAQSRLILILWSFWCVMVQFDIEIERSFAVFLHLQASHLRHCHILMLLFAHKWQSFDYCQVHLPRRKHFILAFRWELNDQSMYANCYRIFPLIQKEFHKFNNKLSRLSSFLKFAFSTSPPNFHIIKCNSNKSTKCDNDKILCSLLIIEKAGGSEARKTLHNFHY